MPGVSARPASVYGGTDAARHRVWPQPSYRYMRRRRPELLHVVRSVVLYEYVAGGRASRAARGAGSLLPACLADSCCAAVLAVVADCSWLLLGSLLSLHTDMYSTGGYSRKFPTGRCHVNIRIVALLAGLPENLQSRTDQPLACMSVLGILL